MRSGAPEVQKTSVLIVLSSLSAEGGPRIALDLCRVWSGWGVKPLILSLERLEPSMRSDFDDLAIPVMTIGFRERGYLRYLKLAKDVFKVCREVRPKGLLSIPTGIHAFIAIGGWMAGVKKRIVHNGTYPWYWQRNAFRKYKLEFQLGRPFTTKIVSCSYYVDEGTGRYLGIPLAKRSVIYNGVNLPALSLARKSVGNRGSGRGAVITMVGRLDRTKDHSTLIRAISLLPDDGEQILLRLIGAGAWEARLHDMVERIGVGDKVDFKGVCSDIFDQLLNSDIFAYSVNREEGLGIALIEAMAAGVPVVASDVSACREVLDDGNAGLLVRPGSPEAMAEGIQEILGDPAGARERAEYARERAREVFSAEAMARGYAELLGLPGPPRTEDGEAAVGG